MSDTPLKRVVVLGATSQVASYLISALASRGWGGTLHSRGKLASIPSLFEANYADLTASSGAVTIPDEAVVISLLPLWICAQWLARCGRPRQVITFSSTSVITKRHSSDPNDRLLAARLQAAEDDIVYHCDSAKIPWTILRPTLIYGAQRDKNVTAIADFIHRFGFFPIAAPGRGLRQPVHAEDLATAALNSIDNPAAYCRTFFLPGGETLSYRNMVERVFDAAGKKPRVVPLPAWSLRMALPAARPFLPARYGAGMFERMNEDLAFDAQPAAHALGFRPRGFQP